MNEMQVVTSGKTERKCDIMLSVCVGLFIVFFIISMIFWLVIV